MSLSAEAAAPTLSAMPLSAHDVVAVLLARHPGLPERKLHKILYYCQGHHLAMRGRPLFAESISADDSGPVIDASWDCGRHRHDDWAPREFGEAGLGPVGYVMSRYGALSVLDLEHLTRAEPPWQLADAGRIPGGRARIEHAWMRDYFHGPGSPGADLPRLDRTQVAELVAGAEERRRATPGRPTTRAALRRLMDGA